VRDAARSQHGFARTQIHPPLTHLESHLPFHHIEPFLLIEMQVKRRAAGQEMRVLNDKEAAVSVTPGTLKRSEERKPKVWAWPNRSSPAPTT